MPAAIPVAAQIAAVAVAKAIGLGAVAGSLSVAGAGLLGAYVANRLQGGDSGAQTDSLLNIKLNTSTTQRTIPLVYGEQKVGGNDVFIEVTASKTKYMYIVHCIGEGVCEGISTNSEGKDLVYINEKLAHEYDPGLIEYWFHSGANGQTVDPIIEAAFPKFTDPMVNTAYLLFKIKYNKKIFSGVPTRTVVLKGLKIKDFRTGLVAWSQNPVLILYDYITNTRYGTGWSEALLDADSPSSSWVSAANYCDLVDPALDKVKYYIDYVVATGIKSQSVIDTILSHFRGSLSWFGGELSLHYSDLRYEVPMAVIDDSHIARDERSKDLVMVSQPNVHSMPSGASIKFVNKRNQWTIDDFPVGESSGQVLGVQFNAFTDRGLALEFGTYVLERERLNMAIAVTLRPDAIELEVNDVVLFSSTELALSDQLVRVKENSITPDGLSQVVFILEADELYNSSYEADLGVVYDIDLPNPNEPPPPIENLAFAEETYDYRGRVFVILKVSFDEPFDYPWFDHVDVYSKRNEADDWTILFSSSDDFALDPVEENTTYFFRIHTVNQSGVKQSDGDAVMAQHTVSGINLEPPPPPVYLSATVTNSSVDFYSPVLYEPEISLWEYRLGPTWDTSVFIASQKFPSLSLAMRPGIHTVWINTWRDCSPPDGLYSTSPKTTQVTVEEPQAPYSAIFVQPITFIGGDHDNTVQDEPVPGVYTLNCAHSYPPSGETSKLVGIWTSIEYDTTHVGTNQLAVIVESAFRETGSADRTWDGIVPVPDKWEDLPATETWNTILKLGGKAAKVEIGAYFSLNAGGPYGFVERLEVLATTVFARYIKLRVKITDTNDSTYMDVDSTYLLAYSRP